MAVFKCKMCGADLEIKEGQDIVTCEYCGSTQSLPKVDNERKLNLYNRANSLRLRNDFDKALFAYQSIIAEFDNESEAYWGAVLAKYGIEYVDDPLTGDKVPTCHRTLFESILNDYDYLKAIEYASENIKKMYQQEAVEIDKIQKRIIAASQKEEKYDVFISYKESDSNNERTKDSVFGEDIYDLLTEKGYRVFFSKITLENKLGYEYEPIIFNALRTAKVMVVIGSKEEYFNAPWVKNEWSRYLNFMKEDQNKFLIPCFFEMNAYDMPQEFLSFQSQDLSKIGAIQDLVRGIEKLIGQDNENNVLPQTNLINLSSLFRLIEDSLRGRNFEKASWILDEALAIDETNPQNYIYRLLINHSSTSLDELENKNKNLSNDEDLKNAIYYSKEPLKHELEEFLNRNKNNFNVLKNKEITINNKDSIKKDIPSNTNDIHISLSNVDLINENAIKSNIEENDFLFLKEINNDKDKENYFYKALELYKNKDYIRARQIFSSLKDYKTSKEFYDECTKNINESIYNRAIKFLGNGYIEMAHNILRIIEGYKDSKELLLINDLNNETGKYYKALSLYKDKKYKEAKEIFLEIKEYKDSSRYLENIDSLIYDKAYNLALNYINEKEYFKAKNILEEIKEYKDSSSLLKNIDEEKLYDEANKKIENFKKNGVTKAYEEAIEIYKYLKKYKESATNYLIKYNYKFYNRTLKKIEFRKNRTFIIVISIILFVLILSFFILFFSLANN